MTRFYLFCLAASTLLFTSSGCTHYYYAPNTLRTPFLQQQHDAQVSVGMISGDEFSGYEFHGVYSPLKHTAVMVNHMQINSGEKSGYESGEGRLTELALGAYFPVGKYTSFSVFGGWGGGAVKNTYDLNVYSDLRFHRTFLQPAFTFQAKWVRFGTAIRFSRLQYVRGDVDVEIGEPDLSIIRNIERDSPIFLPETGFFCGFGFRPFWADFHLNFSDFMNTYDPEKYNFAPATLAISFSCQLDHFWRKGTVGAGIR